MSDNNKNLREEFGDKLMDHNYDGINELDNPAPQWLMAIFYISVAFSIIYGVRYFMMGAPDQIAEYTVADEAHNMEFQKPAAEQAELVLLSDEAAIAEGAQLFKDMNCATCHGATGEGNTIGPNLTDDSWINGCSFDEVFSIIKNGKATKGMTPFKGQMNDSQIQRVASFVLQKLHGSNPENPKEAQGEKCE